MADYNIYIHAFTGGDQSPTTPFQLRGEGTEGEGTSAGGEKGNGLGGLQKLKKIADFALNPDSALGAVAFAGTAALVAKVVVGVAFSISDKVAESYAAFIENEKGDYSFSRNYGNFKTIWNGMTHPISTYISHRKALVQIRVNNFKNEQAALLTGGNITSNNRYGRNV